MESGNLGDSIFDIFPSLRIPRIDLEIKLPFTISYGRPLEALGHSLGSSLVFVKCHLDRYSFVSRAEPAACAPPLPLGLPTATPPMIRFTLHLLTILNLLALHQSALVPLLRLSASDLTQGIFDRGLDLAPFVITDGAREWPASSEWNWQHIRRVCGSMSLAPSCMGDTPLIKARTSQTSEPPHTCSTSQKHLASPLEAS